MLLAACVLLRHSLLQLEVLIRELGCRGRGERQRGEKKGGERLSAAVALKLHAASCPAPSLLSLLTSVDGLAAGAVVVGEVTALAHEALQNDKREKWREKDKSERLPML